jgi:hypothetical protein
VTLTQLRTDRGTFAVDCGSYVCRQCEHLGGSEGAYTCAAFGANPHTYPRGERFQLVNEGEPRRHHECDEAEFRHERFVRPGCNTGLTQREIGERSVLWHIAAGATLQAWQEAYPRDRVSGHIYWGFAAEALVALSLRGDEQAIAELMSR